MVAIGLFFADAKLADFFEKKSLKKLLENLQPDDL